MENGLNEEVVQNHYFFQTTCNFIFNSPPLSTYIVDFNKIEEGVEKLSRIIGVKIELPFRNTSSPSCAPDVSLRDEHLSKIRELYNDDMVMCDCIGKKHGLMTLAEFYEDISRVRGLR